MDNTSMTATELKRMRSAFRKLVWKREGRLIKKKYLDDWKVGWFNDYSKEKRLTWD